MFPQYVDPAARHDPINPEAEARANATPIADDVEVVETIEQANARRATNYLIAFATFVVVIGLLIVVL